MPEDKKAIVDVVADKNKKARRQPKKGKQGYLPKERALCIVIYDLGGKPIPAETVEEILNTVNEVSLPNGLIFSYTQS
jgi:hypothetical protein